MKPYNKMGERMAGEQSFGQRLQDFKATKTVLAWACVGSIVATMIVGFAWGGWVKGSTAEKMATEAAAGARATLAAAVCVSQFGAADTAMAQLASLKEMDSWKRDTFIEEAGWVTLPGVKLPVAGAAELCAVQLINPKMAEDAS